MKKMHIIIESSNLCLGGGTLATLTVVGGHSRMLF